MADNSGLFGDGMMGGYGNNITAANILRSRYRQPIEQAAMENAEPNSSIRNVPDNPFQAWLKESGQRLMNPTDTIAQGVQNFTQQDPVDMGMSLLNGGMGGALGATVWHGSPHLFPPTAKNPLGEFDFSKIGTGEGAQSYGHGGYLADARQVGEQYRNSLSGNPMRLEVGGKSFGQGDDKVADFVLNIAGHGNNRLSSDQALKEAWASAEFNFSKEEAKAVKSTIAGWMSDKSKIRRNPGHLYKVDLPDEHIAKMLDWDKPLSEQLHIQKALHGTQYQVGINEKEAERIAEQNLNNDASEWASDIYEQHGYEPDITKFTNNANWDKYVSDARRSAGGLDSSMTGKDLHNMVKYDGGYRAGLFDPENYQVGTSEHLNSLGIPGIKYLDGSSRRAGEGSRNYVVFPGNEDMLNILERNNQPLVNALRSK